MFLAKALLVGLEHEYGVATITVLNKQQIARNQFARFSIRLAALIDWRREQRWPNHVASLRPN